jgi:apolipoprotein D and lipocalin family protein
MERTRAFILAFSVLVLSYGCVSIPENVQPVEGFELDQYLGTWYEIARLDHSFERDLSKVTATYSMRDDGGVKVVNRGFDTKKNEWEEAEGKAYFVGEPTIGRLKVSFFGPFYGGYNIFDLDKENYQYSLVCGPDKSYLWILARDPNISKLTVDRLVAKAKKLGFSTEKLIFVSHDTLK